MLKWLACTTVNTVNAGHELFNKFVFFMSVQVPEELLREHYWDLRNKPFFSSLIRYMSSGPVVAMVRFPNILWACPQDESHNKSGFKPVFFPHQTFFFFFLHLNSQYVMVFTFRCLFRCGRVWTWSKLLARCQERPTLLTRCLEPSGEISVQKWASKS